MYCCVKKEKLKCRARVNISLSDRKLFLKSLSHNHPATSDDKHKYSSWEVVDVINSFNTHRRTKKRRSESLKGIVNDKIKYIIIEESDEGVS